MDEICEDNFATYIGKNLETLKDVSIYKWYPVINDENIIINFVSAYGDFFIKEKPALEWEDIKIINNEYAIIRPEVDENAEYFSTKNDMIEEIERGMGSEGSYRIAKEMFKLFEKEKLIYFSPEIQEYVCKYTEQDFLDVWEKADRKLQEKIIKRIRDEDLTELPEKLREAIITKRDAPENFSKEMYQNIFNNILKKGSRFFTKKANEYMQKAKLAKIFEKIAL